MSEKKTRRPYDDARFAVPDFWRKRFRSYANEPPRGETCAAVMRALAALAQQEEKRNA